MIEALVLFGCPSDPGRVRIRRNSRIEWCITVHVRRLSCLSWTLVHAQVSAISPHLLTAWSSPLVALAVAPPHKTALKERSFGEDVMSDKILQTASTVQRPA